MPDIIHLRVNAVPVAQPRQRHAISKKGYVTNYTPADHPVNQFKAAVAYEAKYRYSGDILTGALYISIVAVFPRPKSMMWKKREMPRAHKVSKPDIDNVQKSVFDALNGVLWKDDSQITSVRATKFTASGEEKPHVDITIEILEDNRW